MWVAGGLSAETVGDAVRGARPHGVDGSSALESEPGVKDAARVRAFIDAARGALPAEELPDEEGYFGGFGGRFVPETLVPAVEELTATYNALRQPARANARE